MMPILLAPLLAVAAVTSGAERVTIPAPGGGVLTGLYVGAGRGTAGVLFFPMCRADASAGWSPVAGRLRAAGVSSLAVVYRGYGESTAGTGNQRTTDADAALEFLRARIGVAAPVAVAGSSCGVYHALATASRHPAEVRAVVALTGPHVASQLEHVRTTPGLAVFSGAAAEDGPAPGWARELKEASAHPASRVAIPAGRAHGTDTFIANAAFAEEIADWLVRQLGAGPPRD